jgi:AhpD family alkylhydroperoxidase
MGTDYVRVAKDVAAGAAKLGRSHPDAMAAFSALGKANYRDAALSAKMKELIALAIGVTVRCDGCLGHHAKACLELGATREEVVEAIGVAIHMGGGPSMVYGAEALDAFDQHAANGKGAAEAA